MEIGKRKRFYGAMPNFIKRKQAYILAYICGMLSMYIFYNPLKDVLNNVYNNISNSSHSERQKSNPIDSQLVEKTKPIDYQFEIKRNFKTNSYNVVLISIDALRADRYTKSLLPNLWKLASDGQHFKNAYTVAAGTPPAMASLMTSKLPYFKNYQLMKNEKEYIHGLSRFFTKSDDFIGLPRSIVTMAETFQKNGYITLGIVTNPYVRKVFHFERGFDLFEEFEDVNYKPHSYPPAQEVIPRAVNMLEKMGDKNFFMWLHLMDTHVPYNTSEQAGKDVAKLNLQYPYKNIDFIMLRAIPGLLRRKLDTRNTYNYDWQNNFISKANLDYNSAIYSLDKKLGKFIEQIKKLGLYENTIFVILSDHGEEFSDHGGFTHYRSMYDEQVKIPLVFHCPKLINTKKHDSVVRIIDVLPTLINLLNLKGPKHKMDGVSLKPLITGERDSLNLPVYLNLVPQKAIRNKEWKLIKFYKGFHSQGFELYNLIKDPLEQNNVYYKNLKKAESLYQAMIKIENVLNKEGYGFFERHFKDNALYKPKAIKEETRKQLKALGYLQ